jgi:anti-sigma factor RsiW
MTDHLSQTILNALADGELSEGQLAGTNQHLAGCPACTSNALYQCLLKQATAKAGQRYEAPAHLLERLARLGTQADSRSQASNIGTASGSSSRPMRGFGLLGWAAAAVLLIASVTVTLVQRANQRAEMASAERGALVSEVFDQHIATLAGNLPLQVVSTDRHTVKPWFQGKIPFSFNLPQGLPSDTTLDGANLTYMHNQPVAQLLYSIGRHRVSVFLRQRMGPSEMDQSPTERSGFHVMGFGTNDLEAVAISDVDPVRLDELTSAIKHAQTEEQKQSK